SRPSEIGLERQVSRKCAWAERIAEHEAGFREWIVRVHVEARSRLMILRTHDIASTLRETRHRRAEEICRVFIHRAADCSPVDVVDRHFSVRLEARPARHAPSEIEAR